MFKSLSAFLFLLALFGPAWAQSFEADQIVKNADGFRGQTDSFVARLELNYYKKDGQQTSVFKLYAQGAENALLKFIFPKKDGGKKMLSKGNNLYLYFPTTRTAVRIPYEQRLIGQVSNADVTRLYFSHDYRARYLETVKTNGKTYFWLELLARSPEVPYYRIKYCVEANTCRPYKAEYYLASGKLFKTAYFETKLMDYDQKEHVYKVVVVDNIIRGEKTIIEISEVVPKVLAPALFFKQTLDRETE